MEYKERIVFFADILGFKSIIGSSYNEENYEESEEKTKNITAALKLIPEFSDDTDICKSQNIDFQFTQFSDCFIISFAYEEKSQVFYTLLRIQWVQMNLMHLGFLLRGAVTIGPAVHTKDYVFGPAVVEAAELEKKEAVYPRIIVQPEVIQAGAENRASHHDFDDELAYIQGKIALDAVDNKYYIDYFDSVVTEMDSEYDYPLYLMDMKRFIENGLQDTDQNIVKKFIWMRDKYNAVVTNIEQGMPRFREVERDPGLIDTYEAVQKIVR